MATIADLSIGQNVLVAGQITALNPVGGTRYDTVKLSLAKSTLKDEQKFIFADPNNINLEIEEDLAEAQALNARYEAALALLEITLEEIETATNIDTPGITPGHIIIDVTLAV